MRLRTFLIPLIRFFKYFSYQTYYVEGDGGHLKAEKNTRLANTLFNVESGDISIGENTIFGYNVMVLTGKHNFKNGMRISIYNQTKGEFSRTGDEVPREGYDINIGKNCWIASGSIICGNVNIGDSVVVMAGSIVTKDVESNSVVGGVPARFIRKL